MDIKKILKNVIGASGSVGIIAGMAVAAVVSHAMRLPSSTHLGIHRGGEKAMKDLWKWVEKES